MSDPLKARPSTLERIRATYRRYDATGHARRWDRSNPGEAILSSQARDRVLDILASVAAGHQLRVLDLGCGDGSLAAASRNCGIDTDWVGVDIREDAIELAREHDSQATFMVSSADSLDFPDASFDVVIAAVLFSSLPTGALEDATAAEIARVLKPGGHLIWYDMRYPSPANPAVHPVPRSRLRRLFPNWPAELSTVTLIPPLARRLGPLADRGYPLLHRVGWLRSHLVGRLRRPASPTTVRLLLVTGLWPTADMPSAGAFVRSRVVGRSGIRVVAPRRYSGSVITRYLRLAWEALTARGRFDGVEAHVLFPTGVIGLVAAWLRGIPLVVYAHGDEVRNAVYRNPLYQWLGRLVARRARVVVANSEDTAAHVRRLGREDVEVVPVGVDLSRFQPSPRPAERRVLYIGGDRPEKGIDIARRHADTLAGAYLREIDPADVPALVAAHDVLLVPSAEEGFGLAAAEAIAGGRWVVANAVGGLLEVVTDGVNGTLVREGDYAQALASVPEYDPEIVAASASRFDVERHRSGMDQIWRGLLNNRADRENGDTELD